MTDKSALQPAGWYPDPSERHTERYWDGEAWTSRARDDEAELDDPLPQTRNSEVARESGPKGWLEKRKQRRSDRDATTRMIGDALADEILTEDEERQLLAEQRRAAAGRGIPAAHGQGWRDRARGVPSTASSLAPTWRRLAKPLVRRRCRRLASRLSRWS
jgi:hypothetical protein